MNSTETTLYTFEHNMRLIDLAFDCVFINSDEKEETIKFLEDQSNESKEINVIDIFREKQYISEKRIERLIALDVHLQIQMQDQQFGRIAVANGLASKENVENALKFQKQYFEKEKINLKIGDILVENKAITSANRVSILLTQNRIKNENLISALNELCETQVQKDTIKKRFGFLAVKKNLVTMEQVNAALEIQKNESNINEKPRFIGEILKENANLSDDDILQILLEQKQFEKRRLDLEKALYTVKSEIRIFNKLNKLLQYNISNDGLEASVKKIKETDEPIPVYEFIIWLRRVGIKFGIVDDSLLEEFIQIAGKNTEITVAKGYPAEQCIHESIHVYFENEFIPAQEKPDDTKNTPSEKDQVSDKQEGDEEEDANKENNDPLFINEGSIIARIFPGRKGKPGKNVLGYPILPDKPSICIINAGKGVIKKGSEFYAQISGYPNIENGKSIIVDPVLKKTEIKTMTRTINNDTESKYESSTVELRGAITPEAVFKCHSLLLHGNLMGTVISSGNIEVRGCIGTDGKIKDEASTSQTRVTCKGSIRVSKSIIYSIINTDHELLAFNSSVIGSDITAFKGITIKDCLIGNETPCILRFGLKPDDKILAIDYTIDTKNTELLLLKKDADITELTETYNKELKEEVEHQTEQIILKNLIEVIGAPEFFQYEELKDKVKYLYNLPEFSSIRTHYFKFPETNEALAVLDQIIRSTEKMSHEDTAKYLHSKIDPEQEDEGKKEGEEEKEDTISNMQAIETNFKARLKAFEQEVKNNLKEIEKIENEINRLLALRAKLVLIHDNSLSESTAAIKIKNKCEKGTIIKGKRAQLVLDKTLYSVEFKEVLDPKTRTVSIHIGNY